MTLLSCSKKDAGSFCIYPPRPRKRAKALLMLRTSQAPSRSTSERPRLRLPSKLAAGLRTSCCDVARVFLPEFTSARHRQGLVISRGKKLHKGS